MHFHKPCDSDQPLPSRCPRYPQHPAQKRPPKPKPVDPACTCGTPWSETAQQSLGGAAPSGERLAWSVVDAIHSVSDVSPVHLPHVWSPTCTGKGPCTINATTVT